MKKLKFRAWDKENKVMINVIESIHFPLNKTSGKDICYDEEMNGISPSIPGDIFYCGWLYDYELMQFTGLYDSEGKEAYEGDIYHYGFEYEDGTHKYGDRNIIEDIRDFHPTDSFTIIGDIYQNPELLK